MEAYQYDRVDLTVGSDVVLVTIIRPDGGTDVVYPFRYQPIKISYDEEGLEMVEADGNLEMHCRYTPDFAGEAAVEYCGSIPYTEELIVLPTYSHGYVEIGKTDSQCLFGRNTFFPNWYQYRLSHSLR